MAARFNILDAHLTGQDYLLDSFKVADAYLATVLNWCRAPAIDLARWRNLTAYHKRVLARPSFARAFQEERALYEQEEAKRAA